MKNIRKNRCVSEGICTVCNCTFSIYDDEIPILPTMNLNRLFNRKNTPITLNKWEDWIDHVISHCPECRFPNPPISCLLDYDKHVERMK